MMGPTEQSMRDRLAAAMSEQQIEDALRRVVKDLERIGRPVLAYHPWQLHARRAAEGYPDWTIAGPGGVIWRELKTQIGRPRVAQQRWLDTLRAAGADAKIWRPVDVMNGTMTAEIAIVAGIERGSAEVARRLLNAAEAIGES